MMNQKLLQASTECIEPVFALHENNQLLFCSYVIILLFIPETPQLVLLTVSNSIALWRSYVDPSKLVQLVLGVLCSSP